MILGVLGGGTRRYFVGLIGEGGGMVPPWQGLK